MKSIKSQYDDVMKMVILYLHIQNVSDHISATQELDGQVTDIGNFARDSMGYSRLGAMLRDCYTIHKYCPLNINPFRKLGNKPTSSCLWCKKSIITSPKKHAVTPISSNLQINRNWMERQLRSA